MKKLLTILMSVILVLGLAACGNNTPTSSQSTSAPEDLNQSHGEASSKPEQNLKRNALVVYFSVPETTSPDNMNREEEYSTVVINGEVLGNTQYVAYLIQQNTGSDIFRIEPKTPYPMEHAELEAVATQEARESAMPEIAEQLDNIEQYDTIYIGYPIWYGDMPRILYSFFEQYDLSGRIIVPFITSGSSGFSGTIETMQELEPDATVLTDGYSITRDNMEEAEAGVAEWLDNLNLK